MKNANELKRFFLLSTAMQAQAEQGFWPFAG